MDKTQFKQLREEARQNSLDHIQKLIERDAAWDEIRLAIVDHAVAFNQEYR